ncbi:MAG: hypothetical protein KDK66_09480, partial [Deltaproteobacteria bacterium]|nr:hypothetical protein [Deltaproteobacteria bacterium]
NIKGDWLSLRSELWNFSHADEWIIKEGPDFILKKITAFRPQKPLKFSSKKLKLSLRQSFIFENNLPKDSKLRAFYRLEMPGKTYELYEASCRQRAGSFYCRLKQKWPHLLYQGRQLKLVLDSLILENPQGLVGSWEGEDDFKALVNSDSDKKYLSVELACPLL